MAFKAREPGWRVVGYQQSMAAIDRFAASYKAYLDEPDLSHRSEAECYVIGAAFACDAVGAIPGHSTLDKWGVGAIAFLHEDASVKVGVSETAGPVQAALFHARQAYEERILNEENKRRNPLRWVSYGLRSALAAPARLAIRLFPSGSSGNQEVPLALVVLAGVVSFIAVAGVTFGLIS